MEKTRIAPYGSNQPYHYGTIPYYQSALKLDVRHGRAVAIGTLLFASMLIIGGMVYSVPRLLEKQKAMSRMDSQETTKFPATQYSEDQASTWLIAVFSERTVESTAYSESTVNLNNTTSYNPTSSSEPYSETTEIMNMTSLP